MTKAIMMLVLAVGLAVVFYACKNDTATTAPNGTGKISGTVNDSSSGALVSGVTITAQTAGSETQSWTTDASGTFSFSFSTDSSRTVTLTFSRSGFRTRTIVVEVSSGAVTTVNVAISSSTPISGGAGSGLPATIFLVSASPQDISVYGVGGNETSYLTWELRDSLGLPIDAAHADTVNFSVNGGLNGGEFVHPAFVISNALGRVTTSFSAGIRSGVVQVVASTQTADRMITSQPVRIVIHSWFADQLHFTVGAEKLNWPVLFIMNESNGIGVLAGDIYGNPVATNTAIYFTSRAGVIVSSGFTSERGQAGADLISGNPFPVGSNAHTIYGDGYHYVIASTVGQNGTIVKDSVLILWTGPSTISNVTPLNVANADFQVIDFQVSDPYGNTLSAPTTISVAVTGVQAQVAFGIGGSFTISQNILTPPGANTHFSCIVSDSRPDTNYATPATLSISVSSAGNGNSTRTIGGTVH